MGPAFWLKGAIEFVIRRLRAGKWLQRSSGWGFFGSRPIAHLGRCEPSCTKAIHNVKEFSGVEDQSFGLF
jgi:hypothetical protein